ncbi:diaminopimelate decarboxylase [Proteiniborus ethanoligenes]|uniref:Diaminopimelate decarboxylase n=1 Tax=Proteiniborus ethanoligenes TaxID=415015 RepID=A0A1H3QLW8_9FIRM|nr:diaminopimelate decarboxylase [Proteiniborus ethanoligenes]
MIVGITVATLYILRLISLKGAVRMEKLDCIGSNLIFADYDAVELAKKYGTPLYVLSENIIREKCRKIKLDFLNRYPNTKVAYASKAFLTLSMCKIIESEGLGLDVVSGGELYTALKADFPMDKVFFHGNNKSYEELQMAISNEVGRIVVDNFDEIEIIDDLANEMKKKVKILIRVSPGVEGKTHKYISTGQKDSKFGIPLLEGSIDEAVIKAIKSKNIELMGFHFHIGSNLFDKDSYTLAIEIVLNLFKWLKNELGFVVKELNTGGGFGIYYNKTDTVKDITYYTDAIMEKVSSYCRELNIDIPTVIIEPGRWIVGEAGITLYSVGAVKEIPNVRTYVSVDGGLPDNPRPALYNAKYEAIVANKCNLKPDRVVTIAGKCCETGDILIWDQLVPKIERGDILGVLSTGAYNYSMSSNYNKLPKPAVVLLREKEECVIVKRETYEDLISKEMIPEGLAVKK